jgi:hypothetical protein
MGERLAPLLEAGLTASRTSRKDIADPEPRPRDLSLDSTLFRSRFPGLATLSYEDECRRMMS